MNASAPSRLALDGLLVAAAAAMAGSLVARLVPQLHIPVPFDPHQGAWIIDLSRSVWLAPVAFAAASLPLFLLFAGNGATQTATRSGRPRASLRGVTARLAGMIWDRNTFCRGWLITGATGAGKTECGINVLMHQLFQYEAGAVRPGWQGSELQQKAASYLQRFETQTREAQSNMASLRADLTRLKGERVQIQERALVRDIDPPGFDTRDLDHEMTQIELELQELSAQDGPRDTARLSELVARAEALEQQIAQREHQQNAGLVEVDRDIERVQNEIAQIEDSIAPQREDMERMLKRVESAKFQSFPWGGLCVDEKGAYWQILSSMARHYRRSHHLMLLQTRPDWAGPSWKPRARFNLLSDDRIPANTYANALVTTATTLAGGEGDKGFFKTQAESQIGWCIELLRTITRIQKNLHVPPDEQSFPSLKRVLETLSSKPAFDQLIAPLGVKEVEFKGADGRPARRIDWAPDSLGRSDPKFVECINHFSNRYWSQPKDQLGGVQGTIYNYLNYFAQDDVAEVYCADNTFEFDEIDRGMILCVAMPQKLQIERRYVCTLLKVLFYKHVLRRFDKPADSDLDDNNLLVCWQDEAQRFAIPEDGNVDVIRQARGTTVMACQGKPSLFTPLGGKEKAGVILLNLRNRLIFQAADLECATGSADFIGKKEITKRSYSSGKGGRTVNTNKEIKYKIEPHEFTELPKFTAIVCHADGKWKKTLIEPVTTDGRRPPWFKPPFTTRLLESLRLKAPPTPIRVETL